MSQGLTTYDHEIKIDTTTKGLKLARNENGSPMYQVIEEIPDYSKRFKYIYDDWKGGHGQYELAQSDVYFDGQSIDTTQDGEIILGPLINQVGVAAGALDSAPLGFVWFSAISKWVCWTTTQVYWYDGTNWVSKATIAGIVDLKEYNGILYVALGTGGSYYYTADCVTWTATDLTDHHAERFFVAPNAAGTSNVLWKVELPNKIASTTDGRTVAGGGSQWSSPAYIGDTSNNITNMFLVNNQLHIGRTDNLYHYDSAGGVHALMDSLKINKSTVNFQYVSDWQTATYFSLVSGLGEIVGSNTYQPMGPLTDIGNIGKNGTCVGISADKDFLYVAMDEGTNTIIYKGREVRREGKLRWEWCPWIFLGANACAAIAVAQHTSTDRRLWFAYGNYTGYAILSDNPTSDSAARFAPSGNIRMSYTYGTNPYWDKLFQTIITETRYCAAGITVQPKYLKDTETSATNLTSAITTNGVLHTNLTTALAGKRFQFELDLTTNDSTKTPQVLYFEARGIEKPEVVRIHEATYEIGDTPTRKAETIRTFLRGGRTSTTLLSFADLRYGEKTSGTLGTDFNYCVMQPGYPQEVEIIHEKGRAPGLGLKCRFIEINLATATIDAEATALPAGVLNNMVYHNGTTWAALTPAAVMALLSGQATVAFSLNDQYLTSVKSVKLTATSELTISSAGAIVPTQTLHTVDTYADAASDDLDTITNTNSLSFIILRAESGSRTVVVKHNTGNIWIQGAADVSLDDLEDGILLYWDSVNSKWFDISAGGGSVEDAAYGAGWDTDTTHAPSQNAVYDMEEAHVAAADPHTGYRLESADHTHATTGAQAGQLDWDTCFSDAVHSHASDAEGGVLTTTLLDDTAGGTNALVTKASTSNVMYDHANAVLSSTVHPNTALAKAYLNTDQLLVPSSRYYRIELDTISFDLAATDNFKIGYVFNQVQADGTNCTPTNIRDASVNFQTITGQTDGLKYAKVRWSSDAGNTTNTGSGYVTTVTDTTNLAIYKTTGADFANLYYYTIKQA